jgi:hypothetical protein
MLTTVIALCGPAGSGKSTVATYLAERYGAQRYGFATPLKEMVKAALDFTDEQVYGTQEQKETVDPRYGHSPRWFLQRIGTEGCRKTFGEDFWTKQCLDMIFRQNQRLAVIEDTRFCNEAEAVLHDDRISGFVWRLWPTVDDIALARAEGAGKHASEEEWRQVDASLELQPHERGVEYLYKLVDAAMEMVPLRPLVGGVSW